MLCRIALFGKVFVRNKQLNGDNRQLVFLLILYLTSTQNEIFGELYPPYFAVSRFFLSGTRLSLDPARSGCWSNKRPFLLRLIFCQMNMYICHCSVNGRQMLFGIPYDVSVNYTFSSEQYVHFRRVVIQRIKIVSLGEFFVEQIADNNVQIGVMRMMNVACGSGFHKTS